MNEIRKKYFIAFGENLQRLIESSNNDVMTIASLGKIEPKQVYRVLKGEHGASMGTIISIAKGLRISPKDLFDFDFDFGQD